ncbi:hypothetical protein M406DRAFT_357658 [Cryphonectria parasitica EP155]|uniref:Metallo-beta-lactamase domain-containing protein n=1 Tax=Cryphonectria parasitica (strain ATCC 38755 / EP155) TaxID=660469 RepID=A0A9P4XUU9_CRYP1|nr:uncharacterized protein M406DRAFT_357658 [Cryphonectria parasitica EP155]KAF3761247.1 hypothetical protein M406DRAFT_357658 [Cryphonectria parasitica EP155]
MCINIAPPPEKGGIEQFTDTPRSSIWASANDKDFIQGDLPSNSLCRFVGMDTPRYTVRHWAGDAETMRHDDGSESHDLGLVIYHAPGHTPDEVAIWDPQERVLFVGDTMYEWAPIIFPPGGGNLHAYTSTLFKLRDLISSWNAASSAEGDRVMLACGHITSTVDAGDFVGQVEVFFSKVKRGLVEPQDGGDVRGIPLVKYEREDGRISFLGPKSLFEDARVDKCQV